MTWTISFYVDEYGRVPIHRWLRGLSQIDVAAFDSAVFGSLAQHGSTLVTNGWLRPLGEGLQELRVRNGALAGGGDQAVLLRVFLHFHGNRKILLVSAYDKLRNPSKTRQSREIAAARRLLKAWRRSN